MSEAELLAWAAGFIDGEGTISLYKRTDRKNEFTVRLSVVNTKIIALERLQAMFGGSIHPMYKENDRRNWKSSFIWVCSHKGAHDAIARLEPYLLLKHEQALLALQARSNIGSVGPRISESAVKALDEILLKFRVLNKKGRVATSAS